MRQWRLIRGAITALLCGFAMAPSLPANSATIDGVQDITISPTSVENYYEPFRTNISWCVPAGAHTNDTMTIQLPEQIRDIPSPFQVTDANGAVVANVVTAAGPPAIMTFTFTSYVETHQNVCGVAWFDARVKEDSAYLNTTQQLDYVINATRTISRDFTIRASVLDRSSPFKWGAFRRDTDHCAVNAINCITWGFESGIGPITQLEVTDTVPTGQILDCSTLRFDIYSVDPATGELHYISPYNDYALAECTSSSLHFTINNIPSGQVVVASIFASASTPNGGAETTYTNPVTLIRTTPTGTETFNRTASIAATAQGGGNADGSQLTLQKTANVTDTNGNSLNDPGDTVTWSFNVTNSGTTVVTGLQVTDPTAGASNCLTTTLNPGNTTTCTATNPHTITAADVTAGSVTNTATASGTANSAPVLSNAATTNTPVVATPVSSLRLTKTAIVTDTNNNQRTDTGDRVTWSFRVENAGQTTLTGLTVNDPTAGTVTCGLTTLTSGQETLCQTSNFVTITQDMVDTNHVITNAATANATDQYNAAVTSNQSTTNTPTSQYAALRLAQTPKTSDTNSNGVLDQGDEVVWVFTLTNTGTLTLRDININDTVSQNVTCETTTLTPGETTTCTSTAHTITAADAAAGRIDNPATATGTPPATGAVPIDSNPTTAHVEPINTQETPPTTPPTTGVAPVATTTRPAATSPTTEGFARRISATTSATNANAATTRNSPVSQGPLAYTGIALLALSITAGATLLLGNALRTNTTRHKVR